MEASQAPAKRRALRIPLPVEIVGKDEDRPRFLGYLANVSLTGGFIQCSNPRDRGTRLSIRMRLPGVAQPVHCLDAEIIWTRGYFGVKGRSPGMGVQFRELDPVSRLAIERYCDELDPTATGVAVQTAVPEGAVD